MISLLSYRWISYWLIYIEVISVIRKEIWKSKSKEEFCGKFWDWDIIFCRLWNFIDWLFWFCIFILINYIFYYILYFILNINIWFGDENFGFREIIYKIRINLLGGWIYVIFFIILFKRIYFKSLKIYRIVNG